MSRVTKVAANQLFKSEPNPAWFGNPRNPAKGAGWDQPNWLTSRFHFSFAEYSEGKPRFGVLRVLNDDRVQPARGFGTHGHANMEIVTYVVEGELTHQDSMGTAETLGRGAVQFMTAGTGVHHSEHNLNEEHPLRFIQMWIVPRARGLQPNYGSATVPPEARKDKLAHLVSDVNDAAKTPVKINQDANIYAGELSGPSASLAYDLKAGRQLYFVCLEGAVDLKTGEEATLFERHDAAEIVGPAQLSIGSSAAGSHVLLVEMAAQ